VCPYFAPAWAYGGTPRAVFEIAQEQVAQGDQVTVLTSDALDQNERSPLATENVHGIHVFRVKNVSNWLCWKFHFVVPLSLPKELDLKAFDVIHFHEVRTLLHFLVLQQKLTAKIVLSPWGTLAHNNSAVFIKKLLDRVLVPLFQQRVDLGLAQTKHELELLQEFGIGRTGELLPLGVQSISHLPSLLSRTGFRKKLDIKPDTTLLLFVGRYAKGKGLDVLIEAFANVQAALPHLRLVCIGRDDGYLPELHAKVNQFGLNKKVIIEGPYYGDTRWAAYAAANLFVFTPTIYEETSTACLEALLVKTPVVTTFQAEIPFVTEADGVFHVEADVDQVSRKLKKIVTRLDTIAVNEGKIKELFSWPGITKQLKKHYEKIT
jgi:glycosyltransferase involved in cell wall biosynthesis